MFLKNISKATLSLVILISLAGCSGQKEKEQAPQVVPVAQAELATQAELAAIPAPVAPEAQPQTEAQQPS
ncbi:MAG TPA: hypothetical protein VJ201_06970 [Candidatus Babeliales bacterium]|nr:hypothetical protein [Candidatus Babeliales bacterium]